MGIMQRAIETYDFHSGLIGVYKADGIPLAPVSHLITSANIEIQLDRDGKFLHALPLDKNEPKIIIPATEDSAGRTSGASAHPLCDQLCYLAAYNEKRHSSYIELLRSWEASAHSHPILSAVRRYIEGGTILSDLAGDGVIRLDKDGKPEEEKQLVRWRVFGLQEDGSCWTNRSLFKAFSEFYAEQRAESEEALCMLTGDLTAPAKQHPKGVVPLNGNAKLISANDKSGFTYRGRFSEESQAATVGYNASQKAHSALRWLVKEQGTYYGGRLFLCWNPQGLRLKPLAAPFLGGAQEVIQASDYKERLYNTVMSFKSDNQLTGNEAKPVVIASFDAATTGRLALTYYNELTIGEFVQRMMDWDLSCCWVNGAFGVQSPAPWTIINNAFGTQRESKGKAGMETDERVFRQHMQRLISCKLSGDQRIPADIVMSLTQRASTPQAYEKNVYASILFTACAALKKYRKDQYEEEWSMALDTENRNRSYLFGRLLAIADKVESETYRDGEGRQTNATRMQSVFSKRPLYAWRILEERLIPYYRQLKPERQSYFRRLTGSVVDMLDIDDLNCSRELEDVYLLGYYNQRQAFYIKKETDETAE